MSAANRPSRSASSRNPLRASIVLLLTMTVALGGWAQQGSSPQSGGNQQTQQSGQQKPSAPEAGGPEGDIGPIAIPKKKPEETAPPALPPKPKEIEGMPSYSLTVDVPLVTLDAMVLTKDGQFIPNLQKDHFRVLEDNVPQKIQGFQRTEAPITAVLLVEFANTNYRFMYDALRAAYAFADTMQKNDYVAVVEYDMKPIILQDFTNDKNAVYGALNMLRVPGFSESNVFDALYDTLDRLDQIEGRKVVVLVGSGRDTFSKISYDQVMKKIKDTPNVTIFTISTGRALLEWYDARYGMHPEARLRMMDYLQADNQMNTFAKLSGGRWFNPRMEGEFRGIFRDVAQSVRNQYTLSYRPTNTKLDGTFRKLKIEVVQPGTDKPLIVKDQRGKELKYNVVARDGYTARHQVE